MKTLSALVFFGLSLLIIPSFTHITFAERDISFEKVVDVKKESLIETVSDLKNYPTIFPENVKSVDLVIVDKEQVAKMKVGVNGIYFDMQTRYIPYSDNKYVVEVISGDLKGTKMISTLKETWGFDGTPSGGTIINTEMKLETSGLLYWLSAFVPDKSIAFALDNGIEKIVAHAKSR